MAQWAKAFAVQAGWLEFDPGTHVKVEGEKLLHSTYFKKCDFHTYVMMYMCPDTNNKWKFKKRFILSTYKFF